jgi:4-hydroxy-tetrahydrodipicolinate reductase
MADMRLIVTGAGGRMGRTLVKAIAETPGLTLSGAVEVAGAPTLVRMPAYWPGFRPTA